MHCSFHSIDSWSFRSEFLLVHLILNAKKKKNTKHHLTDLGEKMQKLRCKLLQVTGFNVHRVTPFLNNKAK